jgi:predicted metal-dependent hydrolase
MRQVPAAPSAASQKLRLQGIAAPVEIRRHPAARRMTLRVSRARRAVIVTVPVQCDLDAAGRFVSTHVEWVRAELGSLPEPVPFCDGAVIPLRGAPHRIAFNGRANRGRVVTIEAATVDPARLAVSGAPEHAPRRLRDWLVAEARQDLDERVQRHAANLGLRPKRIVVRDQVSRWGSCSTTGALAFSWRLVLAPPFILDYVAAHEVAHLAEMNHGPRFWALVRKTMPAADNAKRWLQVYGMDLHRYGANP